MVGVVVAVAKGRLTRLLSFPFDPLRMAKMPDSYLSLIECSR